MYKKIIIILVFVLMIVGLSGCTEIGIGLTNIVDIKAKPDDYIGKTVTIEGNCIGSTLYDDTDHSIRFTFSGGSLKGKYRLTGAITENDYGTLFIRVQDAKAI